MAERRLGRLGIAAALAVMLSILAASLGCGNQSPAGYPGTATLTLAPPPTATPIPRPTVTPTPTPFPTISPRHVADLFLPCDSSYGFVWSVNRYHFFLHWTPDGSGLIFNRGSEIFSVSPDGAQMQYLANANPADHFWAELYADVSPDGSRIIHSSCTPHPDPSTWEAYNVRYGISIMNADGTGRQYLTDTRWLDARFPVWSPRGDRIAYALEDHWAARLNIMEYNRSHTDLSTQTIFQPSPPGNEWLSLYPPVWSPNGGHIAFITSKYTDGDLEEPRYFLNIIGVDGLGREKISPTMSIAAWSPDGKRIALIRREVDDTALFTIAPDGSSPRMIARIGDWDGYPGASDAAYSAELFDIVVWSPDGGRILYSCQGLCIAEVDGGGVVELSGFNAFAPNTIRAVWSPDGSRIAVQGNAIHSRETAMIHIIEPDGASVRTIDIFDWIRKH